MVVPQLANRLGRARFASGLPYIRFRRGDQTLFLVAARVRTYHLSKLPRFRPPGCIPVFLLEGEAMPFEETVDWTSSAVRVRREISKLVRVSWGMCVIQQAPNLLIQQAGKQREISAHCM
jgi:hypothetical protein